MTGDEALGHIGKAVLVNVAGLREVKGTLVDVMSASDMAVVQLPEGTYYASLRRVSPA